VFAGIAQGRPMAECLVMGAVCAAEIISHYGARPEADIAALVAKRLA
jgi:sugar/nucleoside kinase (ribokinase family)